MKLIVTGATGFIGSEVLRQCIANPEVTSVLVVSRREPAKDLMAFPKVKAILHEDFSEWPASLLDQLEGAEGCIWTVGGKVSDFPNIETARKVSIDYTLAAAQAFATNLAPRLAAVGRKFSFVFCSGYRAEQKEDARVWLYAGSRKLKGAVEKGLFDIAAANSASFEVFVLRPGAVLPDTRRMTHAMARAVIPMVLVSDLAKALVSTCLTQPKSKVIQNAEITKIGKSTS